MWLVTFLNVNRNRVIMRVSCKNEDDVKLCVDKQFKDQGYDWLLDRAFTKNGDYSALSEQIPMFEV